MMVVRLSEYPLVRDSLRYGGPQRGSCEYRIRTKYLFVSCRGQHKGFDMYDNISDLTDGGSNGFFLFGPKWHGCVLFCSNHGMHVGPTHRESDAEGSCHGDTRGPHHHLGYFGIFDAFVDIKPHHHKIYDKLIITKYHNLS